jgi:hypothetical protein
MQMGNRPSAEWTPRRSIAPKLSHPSSDRPPQLRAHVSAPRSGTIWQRRPIRSQGLHPEPPCRLRFQSNRTHSDLSQEDRTQGDACRPTGRKPKQSEPASLVRHQGKILPANTSRHPFVLSSFKYYLTLFSKFFSSFPHGTCSLSVSHKYLALEEIYLPLRAALPSNPTLRGWLERGGHPAKDGILTLSDAMFQWT